jgi:hypothetical protein
MTPAKDLATGIAYAIDAFARASISEFCSFVNLSQSVCKCVTGNLSRGADFVQHSFAREQADRPVFVFAPKKEKITAEGLRGELNLAVLTTDAES